MSAFRYTQVLELTSKSSRSIQHVDLLSRPQDKRILTEGNVYGSFEDGNEPQEKEKLERLSDHFLEALPRAVLAILRHQTPDFELLHLHQPQGCTITALSLDKLCEVRKRRDCGFHSKMSSRW